MFQVNENMFFRLDSKKPASIFLPEPAVYFVGCLFPIRPGRGRHAVRKRNTLIAGQPTGGIAVSGHFVPGMSGGMWCQGYGEVEIIVVLRVHFC